MLLVSTVMDEGSAAYRNGVAFHECPYDPPGEDELEVNYKRAWEVGWNLAERLQLKEPQ